MLAYFVVACIANCTEAGFKMMHPMWIALLLVVTARPAWGLARQRVAGYQDTAIKPSATPEFTNALVGQ
jgi:hypothetical protein